MNLLNIYLLLKVISRCAAGKMVSCWQNGEWKDFYPNINCQGFVLKRKNNKQL